MLVVIEGTDRTGKSTLAEILAGTEGRVIHKSKPVDHPLVEYQTGLSQWFTPGYHRRVLDRWHVGERVWPRVFNRDSEFDFAMMAHVELFLRSRGAVLVFAHRDDVAAQDRELREYHEPIFGPKLADAIDWYHEILCNEVVCPRVNYSFDIPTVTPQYILSKAASTCAQVLPIWKLTSEWIGQPAPHTLLVGERFGTGDYGRGARVPFVPFKTTSGHYLFDQLTANGDEWKGIAAVNAFKGDGSPERLTEIWNALGRPHVIALGRLAHRRCTLAGLDAAGADHPQYWRRFMRKYGTDGYYRHLKEAGL